MRYVRGTVTTPKAARLAEKFHLKYGIGCSPGQHIKRKRKDLANTALILYWPENSEIVTWVLLATDGEGLDDETSTLVTAPTAPNLPRLRAGSSTESR